MAIVEEINYRRFSTKILKQLFFTVHYCSMETDLGVISEEVFQKHSKTKEQSFTAQNIDYKCCGSAKTYRPLVIFSHSQISKTSHSKPFPIYSTFTSAFIACGWHSYHKVSCYTEIPASVLLWCFYHKVV